MVEQGFEQPRFGVSSGVNSTTRRAQNLLAGKHSVLREVGLGTNDPAKAMHMVKETAGAAYQTDRYQDTAFAGAFITRSARGTETAPLAAADDDDLGTLWAYGYAGATNGFQQAGWVQFEVDGSVSDAVNGVPCRIVFKTSDGSGFLERVRIDKSGNVGIGIDDPTNKLHVVGNIQLNARGEVRFADADSSHYVGIKSAATVSSSHTYTLPAAFPGSNKTLQSTNAGILSWETGAGGEANEYSFKTISVSGQSDVVADADDDTLTLVAGANVTITTTADQITFVATDTNTTYSAATSSALGLMKLEDDATQTVAANTVSTTASRTYGVQFNSSGQAVVNVPWADTDTNTTYSPGTLLDVSGTTFNVDLTEAAEAVMAHGDYVLFLDATDSFITKKEAIADVATLFAGSGLTATNSVIAVDNPLNQNTTGNAATVTNGVYTTSKLSVMAATTSAELAGVISDETGSGKLAFATSPTLITPALGTPASGNLANCTFPTLNQDTTGTAATVTGAAQTAITSVGTLTGLAVTSGSSSAIPFTVTGASGQSVDFLVVEAHGGADYFNVNRYGSVVMGLAGNRSITTKEEAGENTAGKDLLLKAGKGTGNAAGGELGFYVSPADVSGESTNAWVEAMAIASDKSTTMKGALTVDGAASLKEQGAADADVGDYGQLWVKTATPNELYFTNDIGNDIQITSGGALVGVGDITSVVAGSGMTGGATSGAATLNVIGGAGITANADDIELTDNGVTLAKMAGLARGKIIHGDASGDPAALAVGSANTVLQSDGTDSSWGTVATAMIADNAVSLPKMAGLARGSIIYGNASGDPTALPVGANTYVLKSDGTDISWATDATGSGSGGIPTAITVADESTDTTCFPLFVTAVTGDLAPKTGTNLAFNSNTGVLALAGLAVTTGNSSAIPCTITGASGQAVDFLAVEAHGGADYFSVNSVGSVVMGLAGSKSITTKEQTGTDTDGHDLFLKAGKGTGTGPGGDLKFYTSPAGGSTGDSTNAWIEAMAIVPEGSIAMGLEGTRSITTREETGTNTAGKDLLFKAGKGTGSGAGGDLGFYVSPAGGGGTSTNAWVEAMAIAPDKTTTMKGALTVDGSASLKEQSAANADVGAYGQMWVKTATPNELYFTNDIGEDIQITTGALLAFTDTNTMGSGFVLEDGDGTEVTITENKEVKFVEGGGIDINWTDVSPGSDADPYDLTFTVADTTVAGDSGSTGITPGDTLTIAGGTNVTTAMSGDTLTITSTDTNTQLTQEQVEDYAGALVASGGTKTGIAVTYQDGTGDMDFVIQTLNQDTTGTAATVTGAAQTAITSVGTLTGLAVARAVASIASFTRTDDGDAYITIDASAVNSNDAKLHLLSGTTGKSRIYFGDTAQLDVGQISYEHTNDSITIKTGNADAMLIASNGDTTIEGALTVDGSSSLKEQSAADADVTAYGQMWVKTATPNQLYFTNDIGEDIQITTGAVLAFTDTNTTYSVQDGELSQNNFTNTDHTKLNGIEASADVTDATNVTAAGAVMDSEVTNLAFVKALAKGISDGQVLTANDVVADDDFLRISGTEVEGLTVAEVLTALNVEAGADVTDATNVTAAGALMDSELAGIAAVKATTGTFLSADESKLDGIEAGATADQSNAEIAAAVEAASDSNTFTNADHTKLNGIEASATADQTAGQILTLLVNGVDSVHYVNGSIDAEHLADNGVTLAKMAGLARGTIIYGDASGDPAALAVGDADQVLTHDGTDVSWEDAGGGGVSLSGTTNNTIATVTGSDALIGEANLTFDGNSLSVTTGSASAIPCTIKGHSSQTADLLLIENSGSASLVAVEKDGTIELGDSGTGQIKRENVSGTNTSGKILDLRGGKSTGNALGGEIRFETAPAGSSGSGVNNHATALVIDGNKVVDFKIAAATKTASGSASFDGMSVEITPSKWLEIKIGGVQYFIPAFVAGQFA